MLVFQKAKDFLFGDKNIAHTYLYLGLIFLVAGFVKVVGIPATVSFLKEGGFFIIGFTCIIVCLVYTFCYGINGQFRSDKF